MVNPFNDFSELEDEFYPGSKMKRRESEAQRHERKTEERRVAREDEGWDAHPKPSSVNGVDIEMFHVGALAKALNRQSVTIRSWIRKGWLPRNMYQGPAVYGSRGNAHRRLWTRQQIEGIVQIAREEGMFEDKPITETRFTERVFTAWRSWR